jgi:hypothetical protein
MLNWSRCFPTMEWLRGGADNFEPGQPISSLRHIVTPFPKGTSYEVTQRGFVIICRP